NATQLDTISGDKILTGLTLDSPTDEDWFTFDLKSGFRPSDIHIRSISPAQDRVRAELLVQVAGQSDTTLTASNVDGENVIDLSGLGNSTNATYFLHVTSDRTPTRYEVEFGAGSDATSQTGDVLAASELLFGQTITGRLFNGNRTFSFTLD